VVNQTVYNFGRINYCQGFFSSGIWMAITSSLLLALILSCGVTALMSINTMDRFDDPKGKPLNIGMEK
jgi:V-type H+-transporting ATPase S1 subunit